MTRMSNACSRSNKIGMIVWCLCIYESDRLVSKTPVCANAKQITFALSRIRMSPGSKNPSWIESIMLCVKFTASFVPCVMFAQQVGWVGLIEVMSVNVARWSPSPTLSWMHWTRPPFGPIAVLRMSEDEQKCDSSTYLIFSGSREGKVIINVTYLEMFVRVNFF